MVRVAEAIEGVALVARHAGADAPSVEVDLMRADGDQIRAGSAEQVSRRSARLCAAVTDPAVLRTVATAVAGDAGDEAAVGFHLDRCVVSPVASLAGLHVPVRLLECNLMEIGSIGAAPAGRMWELVMATVAGDAGGSDGGIGPVALAAIGETGGHSTGGEVFAVEIN